MRAHMHIAGPRRGGASFGILQAFFMVLGLWAVLNSDSAVAQTVQGQLVDRSTLVPVEGALALLLNEDGEEIIGVLTNAAGRFILRAPGPGTFTVKTDRIGYASVLSEPFSLEAPQILGLRLETAETAIELMGIRVEGKQQCVIRPEEGLEVARVWEEARKALTVQDWTEREGLYRFQLVVYQRDMDPSARVIEAENRQVKSGVSRSPIQSLPAADLMENGFIRPLDDGSLEYYGPDANVLLSDIFLDTHCFRLTTDPEQPSAVGLAFEPVRRGGVRDVLGTLWLDKGTGALQYLEYGYTWSEYHETQGLARGRVEFEGLPNGSWIVRKWWIRMPRLAKDLSRAGGGRSGVSVSGIREVGGEIGQISTLDRQRVALAERGVVAGVVWDSTSYGPLEGARVYLSGTSYAGTTDVQGHFLIEGVPEGVFTASFTHPKLDTLGVVVKGVEVEVLPGDLTNVPLGIPSAGSILVEACKGEERKWGAATISGVVRDGESGEAIPQASVRLGWAELHGSGGSISGQDKWFETFTDGEGRYVACSVPNAESIRIQAAFINQKSDPVQVTVLEHSDTVVDLEIALRPGLLKSISSLALSQGDVGIQGAQGMIREPGTGEPVRDAEVFLTQKLGTIRVTGSTDDRGFFRLQTRTPGDYVFSARALGFSEVEDAPVAVLPGRLTVLDVQMAPEALRLDPLVVTAEARTYHLEMQGFYQRKTEGLNTGIFFPPEEIEERRPVNVTDLFWGLPGTRVIVSEEGQVGVYFRAGERWNQVCWPMVYRDRHLISTGGLPNPAIGTEPAVLDEMISPFDLAAIEIYRSPAEIPPEFNCANAGCGVIVLWSKRGGSGG